MIRFGKRIAKNIFSPKKGTQAISRLNSFRNPPLKPNIKVSRSYTNITREKITSFFVRYNLEYKEKSTGQIAIKACPLCPKDHHNKADNLYTLNFKADDGAFLCFRCGSHGSWFDFVRYMLGDMVNFERKIDTGMKIGGDPIEAISAAKTQEIVHQAVTGYHNLLKLNEIKIRNGELELDTLDEYAKYMIPFNYLTGTESKNQRHLTVETLKKFCVGISEEAFKDEEGILRRIPTVIFPFFKANPAKIKEATEQYPLINKDYSCIKVKVRGAGKDLKHFQRFKPAGAPFGAFGLNTLASDSKVVVITEGEFDAMAVYQATNLPSISLPNGASNLPVQLLPYLEGIDRIYLWMDNDEIGQMNIETFANKIGVRKVYIVNIDPEMGLKDANDCLRKDPNIIRELIMKAKPIPSKSIVMV